MVVENQQVTAVIDRRRTVLRNDLGAQSLPHATVVGRHHGHGVSRFARLAHQRQRLGPRPVARHHAQLRIRTIQAKGLVTAVDRQVLQLSGTTPGYARSRQRVVNRPVARKQPVVHEHLAHDVVDERRMHPVPAEITGAGEPVAQLCDPSGEPERKRIAAEPHGTYFLSIPARRPVEKAIWRL